MSASFAYVLLSVRMIGPETPKWVNSISPNSLPAFLPPAVSVAETFFKLSPWSCETHGSLVSSAESEGAGGMTVWPTSAAIR